MNVTILNANKSYLIRKTEMPLTNSSMFSPICFTIFFHEYFSYYTALWPFFSKVEWSVFCHDQYIISQRQGRRGMLTLCAILQRYVCITFCYEQIFRYLKLSLNFWIIYSFDLQQNRKDKQLLDQQLFATYSRIKSFTAVWPF